jgi:nucleotide-binding universal stress UspA family protein
MKTILLHVHDDTGMESRLQAAFDLARAFGGHITCLHATPYEEYLANDPLVVAMLPEEFSGKMARLRRELQKRLEARIAADGIAWDWIHVDQTMSAALIRASRLADVAVVSLGAPALLRQDPRPLAATVAVGGGAPVLGVPQDLDALRLDRPALVAWNGSPEAAAALRAALPILRTVPGVQLVEIAERPAEFPAGLAARFLSRHGIAAEITQRPKLDGSVSAAIEQAARELGAGVIVMGAYGRSRLVEQLFGGVTRDLGERSQLPLLMAH